MFGMKPFKKKPFIISVAIVVVMIFSACGAAHTCSSCGQNFRGNAYHGVFPGTVMRRDCAQVYWHPLDISNFRIR